mgnify:CR=1 FL=1
MIIAAAPGGITSNVLTKFANGDVALSVSLTAVISIISIITVPLIVFSSADLLGVSFADQNINITGTALKMALVVAVPVIVGMANRRFADNFISSRTSLINKITGLLFLIVFIAIWIEEKDNIVEYVAKNIKTNVRELEGAIISLIAQSSFNRVDIDLELAKEIVNKFVKNTKREVSIDYIQKVVSEYFQMDVATLQSKTRKRHIVQARQLAMYFAKKFTNRAFARNLICLF